MAPCIKAWIRNCRSPQVARPVLRRRRASNLAGNQYAPLAHRAAHEPASQLLGFVSRCAVLCRDCRGIAVVLPSSCAQMLCASREGGLIIDLKNTAAGGRAQPMALHQVFWTAEDPRGRDDTRRAKCNCGIRLRQELVRSARDSAGRSRWATALPNSKITPARESAPASATSRQSHRAFGAGDKDRFLDLRFRFGACPTVSCREKLHSASSRNESPAPWARFDAARGLLLHPLRPVIGLCRTPTRKAGEFL